MQTTVDFLFLVCVTMMWVMIAYQLVLTLAGYWYHLISRKEEKVRAAPSRWPTVSILVPARDEAAVIAATVDALMAQDYPGHRMELIVIDDGSTDGTRYILERMRETYPRLKVIEIPIRESGQGKSRALNLGLAAARGAIVAVYDADNLPRPDAVRILVLNLLDEPRCAAVLGKFRVANRSRNLLTRFISLETLTYQWTVQAGRWLLARVAILPGTNYVVWKRVLTELGGWDEQAITEDSELSMRIYSHGYHIKFTPHAVSYEQEPETLRVWVQQRTRWVRGNNYVVVKFLKGLRGFPSRIVALELFYFLALYYLFFLSIVTSDVLLVLGVFKVLTPTLPGPYGVIWVLAFGLFVLELLLVSSLEDDPAPGNLVLAMIMYFTYCQVWIFVVLKALYQDLVLRQKRQWEKTPRFYPT